MGKWIAFCSLAAAMGVAGCSVKTAEAQPRHTDNGVWIGHGYLTTQTVIDQVPKMASDMKDKYKVAYLFVNAGKLNKDGHLGQGRDTLPRATDFLNALDKWEKASGYRFKVLAWINGSLTPTDANYIDVGLPEKRQAIVDECKKLVSTSEADSYVTGTTRPFDGIQVDLEPAGADTKRFDNLKSLMDEIRAGLKPYPGKLTSFTAHKLGPQNAWWWSPTFYYYMARRVDILAAMTYDTGIAEGPAYQKWMTDQTTGILNAVSGELWKNDADHPAPKNGVKVLIGFPAFKEKPHHVPTAENIRFAAPGVQAGLDSLQSANDPALSYFGGAAVYLHTDGSGQDGYANETTDWQWFQQYWLQQNP